ncbi:RNA-directed DNA polymerase, eukaryota, reverse transcriptase zinc-binding domain protein, partial [Tanacetum coccineum]
VGNGIDSRFWSDIWCGEQPLKATFPRIYLLDSDKNCNIASRVCLNDWSSVLRHSPRGGVESNQFCDLLNIIRGISLSDQRDSWQWSVDSAKGYTVASARSLIDSAILETGSEATRWNRNIPIKVNVFLWRLKLNKLPSRVNLDRRSVDVESILYPICLEDLETVNHSFFNCGLAKDMWASLAKWWELDISVCDNIAEWFVWLDSLRIPLKVRLILEGVGGTLMWSIWNFRNSLIFSSCPPKKTVLWDSIVSQSFLWISSRNPSCKFSWIGWLKNPITTLTSI